MKLSFEQVKSLAQKDLMEMNQVIESRLFNRSPLIQDIARYIINSGGKRFRPVLLLLIAKAFGYVGSRHINLAAAVEFIHTATLLHDDVVDHSKFRRGKLTANDKWDNKSSILVGDFLFSQSFLLMSEDKDMQVLEVLSKTAAIIAEGEVKQLTSIGNLSLTEESYLAVISDKTAELFAASCQVGAIVAGTKETVQKKMYNFGLNLGKAFQIIDDVLDYTSRKDDIGKNVGDDFKEGKVTLPIIFAYSKSNEEEKSFWHKVIVEKTQEDSDFLNAVNIFDKYNIIPACLALAKDFACFALSDLAFLPDNEIKKSLKDLLRFTIYRKT